MTLDRFLEVYGSIGFVAGLAQTVYLGAAFWLGGALLRRGRRSGYAPERLLGWHLLLAMGIGYVLVSTATAVTELSQNPPRHLTAPLLAAGYAATIAGLVCTLRFTALVFRPHSGWARAFVFAASTAMCGGWLVYGLSGGFTRGGFDVWVWPMFAGMIVANSWVAAEPLLYRRRLLLQLRLGLTDPLVVDRFRLWAWGSLGRVAMILLGPVGEWVLDHSEGTVHAAAAPVTLCLASLIGLGISVAFWLTFAPTAAYQGWVQRHYASRQPA